jgi:hypothetical protein
VEGRADSGDGSLHMVVVAYGCGNEALQRMER